MSCCAAMFHTLGFVRYICLAHLLLVWWRERGQEAEGVAQMWSLVLGTWRAKLQRGSSPSAGESRQDPKYPAPPCVLTPSSPPPPTPEPYSNLGPVGKKTEFVFISHSGSTVSSWPFIWNGSLDKVRSWRLSWKEKTDREKKEEKKNEKGEKV